MVIEDEHYQTLRDTPDRGEVVKSEQSFILRRKLAVKLLSGKRRST